MNKITYGNRELVFGTYFMSQLMEDFNLQDISEITALMGTEETPGLFQKNPFKYIPLFIKTAINSSAEMYGLDKMQLHEVAQLIDDEGGIIDEKIIKIFEVFGSSSKVKTELTNSTKKKVSQKIVGK
jgi:hypothetical protein